MTTAAQRFEVLKADLTRTRCVADPHAPGGQPLAPGQVRMRIEHFALTANNITYAAFGEAMHYWDFFPGADAAWGCIPVWGFAVVAESLCEGIEPGERCYGYWPMASHVVLEPVRMGAHGFVDGAAHRAPLPAVYNQVRRVRADPGYAADREAEQAILQPLFSTSFLIDDFLAEAGFFGKPRVLLSSASSKTAWGTAFCLARRRATGGPEVVGLTSPANLAFTRSLGCYDTVLTYDELSTLPAEEGAVFVDFAGNADLRRRIHEHFGDHLGYSCSVGGTHWSALGSGAGLPGPRPTLFFAPAQLKKRSAPPPEGWGAAGVMQRIGEAFQALLPAVTNPAAPWLVVRRAGGADAVDATYHAVLAGRSDPREGWMLSLAG